MISKKTRTFFASLMEVDSENSPVHYDPDAELYRGYFHQPTVTKMAKQGFISLHGEAQGEMCIRINLRLDFLSGFASGANEASLGRDQYYADYNAHPFAFSLGHEQFHHQSKRPPQGYRCHGLHSDELSGVYLQT
jgi:hypothetical protein